MGKLFLSTFVVAGLMVFGPNLISAQAQEYTSTVTQPGEIMVKGQVTAVEGDTLQIKDKSGYNHSFKVTDPNMLNEFKSGDNVEILVRSPKAMRRSPAPTPTVMQSSPVPTPTPAGLRQRLKKYMP